MCVCVIVIGGQEESIKLFILFYLLLLLESYYFEGNPSVYVFLFVIILFKGRLLSEDSGKHLMGVVDLLQKHSLIEADINVLGENVKVVIQHLQHFTDSTKSKIFFLCHHILLFHMLLLFLIFLKF